MTNPQYSFPIVPNLMFKLHPRRLMKPLAECTSERISFGCSILDRKFGGGIPIENIIEICGESGSGKTQLVMQLALSAVRKPPNEDATPYVLFLNSELSFPIQRILQIATRNSQFGAHALDKVFVRSILNVDEFYDTLVNLESFIKENKVKLVIVDSITTLFRGHFGNIGADMTRRRNDFFKIASKLKLYAAKDNLVVVITNQVTDVINDCMSLRIENELNISTSDRLATPALGISWANCVNTRLIIILGAPKEDQKELYSSSSTKSRRKLKVVFAPHLGDVECKFVIRVDGVVECSHCSHMNFP